MSRFIAVSVGLGGIARVGLDAAGGTQMGGGQHWVELDGALVAVRGDGIADHPPHPANAMAEGSDWVEIDGIPVCRVGHRAACGHATTGTDWIDMD